MSEQHDNTSNTGPASTQSDETPEVGTSGTPDPVQGLTEARDRYRNERDTAREELATATARIEALQRAEVERLAAEHLAVPADFWLSENAVADYLTESGDVDPGRVAEDAKLLLTERPLLGKRVLAQDPSQGLGGETPMLNVPGWGSLLR